MALFTVRPSRGSWAFFGLVALSAVAARGYDRHERSVARRDGPLAETAMHLGRCVLGDSMEFIAIDGASANAQQVWSRRIADRMRTLVSLRQEPSWPSRCANVADQLASRLAVQQGRQERTSDLARSIASALQTVGSDPTAMVSLADSDSFADQLATLFIQVRALSDRSAEHWDRIAVLPASTDLTHPDILSFERFRPMPAGWQRVTLVDADTLLYYSASDGTARRATFGDRTLASWGSAVPVLDGRHGQALRLETDDGASFLPLTGAHETPRLAMFPEALAHGREGFETWELAASRDTMALLTLDQGTVSLRASPADGPLVWTPPTSIGHPESALAATVSVEPDGRFRVTVLRPRINEAYLEQFLVTLGPSPSQPTVFVATEPAQPPPGQLPSAQPPPAQPANTPAGEHSVGVEALAAMTLTVSEPVRVTESVPMFGGRVATCAAGAVRYIAVHADRNAPLLTVLRIDGADVTSTNVSVNIPRSRPWVFTCDIDRALIGTDATTSRGGYYLARFPTFGESASLSLLEPPLLGPGAQVLATALMDGGVVAVAANRTTLRTYRLPRGATEWTVNGLVMLLEQNGRPSRAVRRVEALAEGSSLALRIDGMETPIPPPPPPNTGDNNQPPAPPPPPPVPFTALVRSTDGAVRFSYR